MKRVPGYGPARAEVVIVGEAPGEDEELQGKPFVGASGKLLTTLLREAGIRRDDCYITNVCKYRPPNNKIEAWVTDKKKIGTANEWPQHAGRWYADDVIDLEELRAEIASREPKVIVALGNAALWALFHEWGIMDWRGSELVYSPDTMLIPTLHPASVLRNWATRAYVAHDLQFRVAKHLRAAPGTAPAYDFNIAPSIGDVASFLEEMKAVGEGAIDVETSRGQIVCVGIGVSKERALCIPFISENYGSYWPADAAKTILGWLARDLPQIEIIGQNFNYDASYFLDNFNLPLDCSHDTKIAANVLFPGVPANLGFLSSMNCEHHIYWKDDARDWNNLRDFDSLFNYNCRDVCATFEIAQVQKRALKSAKLQPQFEERMRYSHYVLRMQERGVIRDAAKTVELENEIDESCQAYAQTVAEAAGHAVNIGSPKQVSDFIYKELGLRRPVKRSEIASGERGINGPTGNEELKQVMKWHPERKELLQAILQHRALTSVKNNFLNASLDPDGKLRSSFLTTGTETYRLTSSKNNFHRGTNLLNIPGNGFSHSGNKLPNLRRAIVPPSGFTIFDCDLARADLQVVVWEADDADLKQKLREGVDIHTENAKDVFGVSEPTEQRRELAKKFVHLTDYGGMARTCAIQCGTTVHEADMAQRRWFSAHPGIKEWHRRTRNELETTRTITNKFGYRIVFFDRIDDSTFRDALAWKPQSTIAIVTSLVHMRMEDEAGAEVLLQMYDSVMGMYPTVEEERLLPLLYAATRIEIPYDDPLVIAMGIKTSDVSWGDCKKRKWA